MGTKRVGLARMEALIENLKRELAMGGASLSGLALSKLSMHSATKGSDLADDANAVNFVIEDHGKSFVCLRTNGGKTLNLPSNVTAADVGTQITILQGADLINSGVLTITAGSGNTWCENSWALGYNSSRVLAPARPADANTTITITGANTNSAWGIGSRVVFTCVAAGEWYFEIIAEPLGTGNAAIAYS